MTLKERLTLIAIGSGAFLLLSACIVVLVHLFSELRVVTLSVGVALVLSTAFTPMVHWLSRHKVPRGLAAALLIIVSLGGVALFMFLFGPAISTQLSDAFAQARSGLTQILDWMANALPVTRPEIDKLLARGTQQLEENLGTVGAGLVSGAALAIELVVGVTLAIVLLFFFLRDGAKMFHWLLGVLPSRWRTDVNAAGHSAWRVLGGFLRGSAVVACVDAVGIGLGLWAIGVPLVLPLALLTFLGGFVPIVGAFTAGIFAVLVAWVSNGMTDALLAGAVVIVVQQVETNVLEPVVMGKAVPLHPAVILVVIAAGSVLGGVVGAFVAVPLTAVVVSIGTTLRLRHDAVFAAERRDSKGAGPRASRGDDQPVMHDA